MTDAMTSLLGKPRALATLLAASRSSTQPSDLAIAEMGSVLPFPSALLTWVEIRRKLPGVERVARFDTEIIDKIMSAPLPEMDDLCVELIPPRTKKDLSIRRSRFADLISFHRTAGSSDLLRSWWVALPREMDYIWCLITLVAATNFGDDWFKRCRWLGLWDGGLEDYITAVKKLNDVIKTRGLQDKHWPYFVELGTLTGYRNPPYPGFDLFSEAAKLADGGKDEDFEFYGESFVDVVRDVLIVPPRPVEYLSFHDYVVSGVWLTAGASSVGRVDVTIDGKRVKFKARKNLLPYIYSFETLYQESIDATQQTSTTIIKSELGKIRIAVAGDIYTYLKMSWINHLLGGAYKDWHGGTLEETVSQQTSRMAHMLQLCSNTFGVPFDYAAFDHQPSTRQIQIMTAALCQIAKTNVPVPEQAEFTAFCVSLIKSYENAWLITKTSERQQRDYVAGGLQSGMRWTSVIGNAWNSVMTEIVIRLCKRLKTDELQARYIRGDDSAIFSNTYGYAALVERVYKVIGVQGGEGKFSIRRNAMEFLRIWYSDRAIGYPARALPGLVQRKPWSGEPWTPLHPLRAVWDVATTLTRRGVDSLSYAKHVLKRWCSLKRVTSAALSVPSAVGGWGILPWDGCTRLSPPMPSLIPPSFPGIISQDRRRNEWLNKAAAFNLPISVEQADALAQSDLDSTIGADDVRGVASTFRKDWNDLLRSWQPRVTRLDDHPMSQRQFNLNIAIPLSQQFEFLTDNIAEQAPRFGSWRSRITIIQDAQRILKVRDETLGQWLRRDHSDWWEELKHFHHTWSRSDRLDYLFGKIPFSTTPLHPLLRSLAALMTAADLTPNRPCSPGYLSWFAQLYSQQVASSPLSWFLFSW